MKKQHYKNENFVNIHKNRLADLLITQTGQTGGAKNVQGQATLHGL